MRREYGDPVLKAEPFGNEVDATKFASDLSLNLL